MKNLKRSDGFTLIELIVGINLAFLGITFLISFFLIINKTFHNTLEKNSKVNEFYTVLNLMENKINSINILRASSEGNKITLSSDSEQILVIAPDSLILKDNFTLYISDLSTVVNFRDGSAIKIKDGLLSKEKVAFKYQGENQVEFVQLQFNKFGTLHNLIYSPKVYSLRKFVNIE